MCVQTTTDAVPHIAQKKYKYTMVGKVRDCELVQGRITHPVLRACCVHQKQILKYRLLVVTIKRNFVVYVR